MTLSCQVLVHFDRPIEAPACIEDGLDGHGQFSLPSTLDRSCSVDYDGLPIVTPLGEAGEESIEHRTLGTKYMEALPRNLLLKLDSPQAMKLCAVRSHVGESALQVKGLEGPHTQLCIDFAQCGVPPSQLAQGWIDCRVVAAPCESIENLLAINSNLISGEQCYPTRIITNHAVMSGNGKMMHACLLSLGSFEVDRDRYAISGYVVTESPTCLYFCVEEIVPEQTPVGLLTGFVALHSRIDLRRKTLRSTLFDSFGKNITDASRTDGDVMTLDLVDWNESKAASAVLVEMLPL